MTNNKTKPTATDILTARHYMRLNKIQDYKVIGICRRVVGWCLVGYGVVGVDFGVSVWVGCALLGIPTKTIIDKGKHCWKKALYIGSVLVSPSRLRYELKCLRLGV